MNKYIIFLLPLTILLFLGCDSGNGDGGTDKGLQRQATGRAGEVILVMDSALYSDTVGRALRSVMLSEVAGLPREEPYFNMSQVEPEDLNNVLKSVSNLIFVMTLDDKSPGTKRVRSYFTESSLNRIENEPDLFMFSAKDVYAKGQQVLYLFSKTSDQLATKIMENEEQIRSIFNVRERERLEKGLFKSKALKGISDALVKDHDFYLKIPFGYKMAANDDKFVWFRQMNDDNDKNIFVTYRPYVSEEQFSKEQIIQFRDSIARKKLFEDPAVPDTYIITETGVPFKPVVTKEVNFNGLYAVETRGLWRTRTASMGGPFLSYVVVDEKLGRLYYLEGFVFSPGKSQREFMRELEVILHTFEPRS
ncbi:MAG: DUF4837 family protein [Candidatus Cyclobacteriaceae bacterium M2_1C_046]